MDTKHYLGEFHTALLNNPRARQQALLAGQLGLNYLHLYTITENVDVHTRKIYDRLLHLIYGKEAPKVKKLPPHEYPVLTWIDITTFNISNSNPWALAEVQIDDGSLNYFGLRKKVDAFLSGYFIFGANGCPTIVLSDIHTYIFGVTSNNVFYPIGIVSDQVKSFLGHYCLLDYGVIFDNEYSHKGFTFELSEIFRYLGHDISLEEAYVISAFVFDINNPYKGLLTLAVTTFYEEDSELYFIPVNIVTYKPIKPFESSVSPYYLELCEDSYLYQKYDHGYKTDFSIMEDYIFPPGDWIFNYFSPIIYYIDMVRWRVVEGEKRIVSTYPSIISYIPTSRDMYHIAFSNFRFKSKYPLPPRHSYFLLLEDIYASNPTDIPSPTLSYNYVGDGDDIQSYYITFNDTVFGYTVYDIGGDFSYDITFPGHTSLPPLNVDVDGILLHYSDVFNRFSLNLHFIYPNTIHAIMYRFPTFRLYDWVYGSEEVTFFTNLLQSNPIAGEVIGTIIQTGNYQNVITYTHESDIFKFFINNCGYCGGYLCMLYALGMWPYSIHMLEILSNRYFSCPNDSVVQYYNNVYYVILDFTLSGESLYIDIYGIEDNGSIEFPPSVTIYPINISYPAIDAWEKGKRFKLYSFDYRKFLHSNVKFYIDYYPILFGSSSNINDYMYLYNIAGTEAMYRGFIGRQIFSYTFLNGIYLLGENGSDYVHFFDHLDYKDIISQGGD